MSSSALVSVGGLLPSDLLGRIGSGDRDLVGTAPESYGLVPGERLTDHVTRSWNRLTGVWANFSTQLADLPESERTATSLTRERWLRPLFDELGFGGLSPATPAVVEGKEYALSHQWGESVPMHLLGARLPIDRRSPGVPGAAISSPHGLVQEFLNRSGDHLWAVVTNGLVLRLLRDNKSLTRQAYVEFDLQAIFDGEVFSEFALLWLVVHRSRFEGDIPKKCVLEQWTNEAATAGTRALDRLREGVESAIEMLGAGFLSHAANSSLRSDLESGALSTDDYQRQLLRVVYRLLFLMIAESRDLLLDPSAEETAKFRYQQFYSMDRLVRLAEVRRGSAHDDLWQGVTLITHGLSSEGLPALALTPLGSFLWSEDSTPALTEARLSNRSLLGALRSLTIIADREAGVHRRIDYRNLGAEELGSVYESLLELHANIDVGARTFELDTAAGNERKTTGSYYTPTSLITELLNSALEPVLDEAAAAPDPEVAILALSVLDPACGSGHFLIAAANRIAHRLATIRAEGIEPAPDQVRTALRDVVGSCVYGIDINPMAVELCKISLWIEAMDPVRPLSFLDHRIVCGNALLGTTPRLLAEGLPDDAFKAITGDDKAVVSALKARNKGERAGQGTLDLGGSSVADLAMPFAEAITEIECMPDVTVADIDAKRARLAELQTSDAARRGRLAADAWCAGVVAPKAKGEPPITTATVRQAGNDPARLDSDSLQRIDDLAAHYQFLHLHLAFPDIFQVPAAGAVPTNQRTGWSGGFSCVLGNPPWDKVQFTEQEWFASRDPEIADASGAERKGRISSLAFDDVGLFEEYETALIRADVFRHFLGDSSRFPLCGRGKINTYSVFTELMRDAISGEGRVGAIVQSGIATDDTTKFFFQDLVESRNLVSLFDFENRRPIFENVHRSTKFCLLTLTGDTRPIDEAEFFFFALEVVELAEPDRRFSLTPEDFERLNPNTRTCPVFRTRRDAEIAKSIYQLVPVLVRQGTPEVNPWRVTFKQGLFNMTSDSHLFRNREDLENAGWALEGNVFSKGVDLYLPLYEGKMIHHFDHRWATYENEAFRSLALAEKADPNCVALPRYWVPASQVADRLGPEREPLAVWRDVARSTDERSFIATAIPPFGVGNNAPICFLEDSGNAVVLLSCFASYAFDFVARLKAGGAHMNFFTVRQLPVLSPSLLGELAPWDPSLRSDEWIKRRGRELFDSAIDLTTEPQLWDLVRRELLRAELDAAFFHLYAIRRDDVEYIMDTFPLVRKKSEEQHGEYRTKRVILEIYDRMAEATASGEPYETVLDPPPGDDSLRQDPSTRPDWADIYERLAGSVK